MPDLHHVFVAFGPDSGSFRVALRDVHEIIRLEGSFDHLDPTQDSVRLRKRTIHMVDERAWSGEAPERARHLIVFERNRRLLGLAVARADRAPVASFKDLPLEDTVQREVAL